MGVKYKNICPTCFMEDGYSIELAENDEGVFQCKRDETHKFKRDEKGFWKKM